MLPFSAACERNKDPILDVLRRCLSSSTQVLEIGSGTGQHAVHFARALTHLAWQPTERLAYLEDLGERVRLEGSPNIRSPTLLDVSQVVWPVKSVDAVFTANTLHIMGWREVVATFAGIGTVLAPGGVLCIYGPFRYEGRYTSDSNRDFNRMLQERDPASGLRDLADLTDLAGRHGLRLEADHDLPANNRLLIFLKEPG
jgi:SAM-dependent methyltransferase